MPLPREEKDMVDLSFKDFIFSLRTYDDVDFRKLAVDPITGQSVIAHYVPAQRMLISAYDMLVSFGRVGKRRKKVLGQWATPLRPRNYLQPLIQVALVAYPASIPLEKLDIGNISEEVPLEYSIFMRMLPVRCYLDYHLIEFFRKFSVKSESTNSNESDSVDENSQDDEEENEPVSKHISLISSSTTTSDSRFVIKSLSVAQTDIKIDYTGSLFNINALKTGDYLQLLNIMPLDGLELTLKDLQMQNLPGIEKYLDVLLQHWVKDIYDNQLHRVISGTAPLRGLTNIGSDLKKLLFIPLNDYRSHSKNSNHVMKELGKGTNTLMRTITREALSVSHAATMFVANTLSDIVQGDERMLRRNSFSGRGRISNYTDIDQPKGLMEGIGRAYSSVTREVNAAMDTVIAIPIEQYEGSGSTGKYVKSVIRALPVAVLRPISGIAEGLSYTILGLRNDLDPFARMEEQDMWNVDLLPPDITSTLMARSQELSSSTVSTKDKGNNHTQKPAAGTSSKAKGSGSNSSKHSSHSASAKRDDSAKGSSSRSSRGSTRSSNDNTHYITTKKTNAEQAASKRR